MSACDSGSLCVTSLPFVPVPVLHRPLPLSPQSSTRWCHGRLSTLAHGERCNLPLRSSDLYTLYVAFDHRYTPTPQHVSCQHFVVALRLLTRAELFCHLPPTLHPPSPAATVYCSRSRCCRVFSKSSYKSEKRIFSFSFIMKKKKRNHNPTRGCWLFRVQSSSTTYSYIATPSAVRYTSYMILHTGT